MPLNIPYIFDILFAISPSFKDLIIGTPPHTDASNSRFTLFFSAIILYFGAIFWTLGYDTIYGYQDITDDEIIGVKSTSIKFKDNPKKFLFICYSITIIFYLFLGQLMNVNNFFYLGSILMIIHLFFYQIKNFNLSNTNQCLKIFKSNNLFGLIVLLSIILSKMNI